MKSSLTLKGAFGPAPFDLEPFLRRRATLHPRRGACRSALRPPPFGSGFLALSLEIAKNGPIMRATEIAQIRRRLASPVKLRLRVKIAEMAARGRRRSATIRSGRASITGTFPSTYKTRGSLLRVRSGSVRSAGMHGGELLE